MATTYNNLYLDIRQQLRIVRGIDRSVFQGKVQTVPASVQPLQSRLALLNDLQIIVNGRAVVGRDQKVADHLITVGIGNLPHSLKVTQRLAHLHIVHIDIAVVHPVVGKGATIGALTLGNLIFMVGKDQVLTAAVQVNGRTKVPAVHR